MSLNLSRAPRWHKQLTAFLLAPRAPEPAIQAGAAEVSKQNDQITHLTEEQYNALLKRSGFKGKPPISGHTRAIGFGLIVANNSDLPRAVESGRGYAVQCKGIARGKELIHEVLGGAA